MDSARYEQYPRDGISPPRSRLNIKGLLDLDQMSAVITGLIEQVDRQNTIINDLNERLNSFVEASEFAQRFSSLEGLVTKFSNKLDAVQQAATGIVLNKKYISVSIIHVVLHLIE